MLLLSVFERGGGGGVKGSSKFVRGGAEKNVGGASDLPSNALGLYSLLYIC